MPAVQTIGMSQAEAKTFGQRISKLGLKRLSSSELVDWNRLRIKLAEADHLLCAGLLTGINLNGDQVLNALSKIDTFDAERWLNLSVTGARLEILQKPYTKPAAGAVERGLASIRSTLSSDDRAKFDTVLNDGVEAQENQACWAMMTVMKRLETLPDSDSDREEFLRALAAL